MQTIETLATIEEDGRLTATIPQGLPRGRHRVVIVPEAEPEPLHSPKPWPEMKGFRERLGAPAHPGNTVLEMREEERSPWRSSESWPLPRSIFD